MTAETAGGQPITTDRSSSMRNPMPDQYEMNCATSTRACRSHNHRSRAGRPSPDVASPMFSPSVDWYSDEKRADIHLECHRAASS
jgi:hypothetical protein